MTNLVLSIRPGPVQPSERIESMDVLRGFALFGILLVNMYDYLAHQLGPVDAATQWIVGFLAEDNFYPLFSLLFGAGFALQMMRATGKAGSGIAIYARRIAFLFLIGAVFWVVVEDRNILLRYSMLAVPLLLFRNASPRVLLLAAVLCVGLAANAQTVGSGILAVRASGLTAEQFDERVAAARERRAEQQAGRAHAMETGAYGDFARQRADALVPMLRRSTLGFHFTLPHIFAMFLLGAYAVRRRFFHDPERHAGLLRRVVWIGATVGIAGELIVYVPFAGLPFEDPLPGRPFRMLQLTGWLTLAVAYAAAIILLMRHERWKRRLLWFAPAGRMALTNYTLQSVFLTLIFLPYGLGLQERIGPLVGAMLTIVIFATQVAMSRWWLARYRFGPAEWLWRSLTYGRPQPLRDPRPAPAMAGRA